MVQASTLSAVAFLPELKFISKARLGSTLDTILPNMGSLILFLSPEESPKPCNGASHACAGYFADEDLKGSIGSSSQRELRGIGGSL